MSICLIFARLLSITLERLALRQSDFCLALRFSNRSVHQSPDTLVGHFGFRVRPVLSGPGFDLLYFRVRLGVLLDRIALCCGDVRLNVLGRFGFVAGTEAQ